MYKVIWKKFVKSVEFKDTKNSQILMKVWETPKITDFLQISCLRKHSRKFEGKVSQAVKLSFIINTIFPRTSSSLGKFRPGDDANKSMEKNPDWKFVPDIDKHRQMVTIKQLQIFLFSYMLWGYLACVSKW